MILEGGKRGIDRGVVGWMKYERLNFGTLNRGVGWYGCSGNDVKTLGGWRKCEGWVQESLNWSRCLYGR